MDVIRATFDGRMREDGIQYIGPSFKDITKFLDEVTEGMICEDYYREGL